MRKYFVCMRILYKQGACRLRQRCLSRCQHEPIILLPWTPDINTQIRPSIFQDKPPPPLSPGSQIFKIKKPFLSLKWFPDTARRTIFVAESDSRDCQVVSIIKIRLHINYCQSTSHKVCIGSHIRSLFSARTEHGRFLLVDHKLDHPLGSR